MRLLRRLTLSATYHARRHGRQRWLARMAAQGRAPMMVLFYHRIADEHPNPWTLSKDQFVRHMDFVRRQFDFVPLEEVQRRMRFGQSHRPAVTITFDDGYAENCQFALPYLIRHRIPTVYFVSTTHVRDQLPFAHDVAAGRALPVNTMQQLRAAAAEGIEIGLHTADHCNFDRIDSPTTLHRQIIDAKADLEAMIDRPVRYFAVPFGMPQQMRPAVFAAAHQCGLQGVCSGFGGYNEVGEDPFHLHRIHGDPQFIRLRNWLSYDPRKVRGRPRLPLNDHVAADMSRWHLVDPVNGKKS